MVTQNPLISARRQLVKDLIPSVDHPALLEEVRLCLEVLEKPQPDAKELLDALQFAQRFIFIHLAGLSGDNDAIKYLMDTTDVRWKEAQDVPVADSLQDRLAQQFIGSPAPCDNPKIMLRVTPVAPRVVESIVKNYLKNNVPFDVDFPDDEWLTRLMERASEEGLSAVSAYQEERYKAPHIDKVNVVVSLPDSNTVERRKPSQSAALNKWKKVYGGRASNEDAFYTLTIIPTPHDAEVDEMDYEKYVREFFQTCNQPWLHIEKDHVPLIQKLDKAKTLRITNSDGTDITFDIEGQTFANSVVAKNIPGSEVFSAPRINGVNGKIVAKGKFQYDGPIMENITLRFVDGVVVEAHAEVGNEHLQEILNRDEGVRRVGEIALGTNPSLKRHVVNGLLVEKIGGSFHIALGRCYNFDTYNGVPVNVKNGNDSQVHWDITTMLAGKEGRVWADDELIQRDGVFTDPKLKVLNEGWAAVPLAERPEALDELFGALLGRMFGS